MAGEIVGREQEIGSIRAFLDRPPEGPAAIVLEGEAGIGKSTLWLAAVSAARDRGYRVLLSRPAEVERDLAHAGLGDLFEEVSHEWLNALSAPRRRALEVALLREEASGGVADERALAVAVRDVLDRLGERTPVLIAIDDIQWLDRSSSAALAFALRRLDGSPVVALLARRTAVQSEPSELEQAFAPERLRRIDVGPLSLGALHRLLFERRGQAYAHQTLLRIHEQSGGNPFYALELTRNLDPDVGPLEPLPVPETLEELVRARLAGLPHLARDGLAFAAALGAPSTSLLERLGVGPDKLEPAEAAHVIERQHDVIRFTHPLLSSVLYNDLGPRRRIVHEQIAAVVDDPVTRARHLALATELPSAAVAAALDVASILATDRGLAAGAAELAEAALRLTPPSDVDSRHQRALAAARAHRTAGEWTRARAMAVALLDETAVEGSLRAEAMLLLAGLVGLDHATTLLEEASREATSDPALQSAIQCQLAWTVRFSSGFVGAFEHARRALELADDVDDDALRLHALEMLVFLGRPIANPKAHAYARRAFAIADALGDARDIHLAQLWLLDTTSSSRKRQAARELVDWLYEDSRERDELAAAEALGEVAMAELAAGNWERAADCAQQAFDVTTQYGLEVPWAHLPIAIVSAHLGRLDVARAHSERSLELGEEQFGRHTPVHLGTLGFVAHQGGDLEGALRWFDEAREVTTALGWREAGHRWWVDDHVETLLGLDRVDDAVRILDEWEAERTADDDRTLGDVTRCRGLVEAARGNVRDAAVLLADAAAQHAAAQDAFGRARAMLALGIVLRRDRQKRAARDAIVAALAGFSDLGAATWVNRARAELGRIGGRTSEPGLTAAERRVATLVAEGQTNREVAAALFLGERTVETHLSHVYAKLGVRSRAELARRFRSDEQSSGKATISG